MKFLGKEWISHLRTNAGDTVSTCKSKSKAETSGIDLSRPHEEIYQCRLSTSARETSRLYVNTLHRLWTKLTVNASGLSVKGWSETVGTSVWQRCAPLEVLHAAAFAALLGREICFIYRIWSTVNHICLPFLEKYRVFHKLTKIFIFIAAYFIFFFSSHSSWIPTCLDSPSLLSWVALQSSLSLIILYLENFCVFWKDNFQRGESVLNTCHFPPFLVSFPVTVIKLTWQQWPRKRLNFDSQFKDRVHPDREGMEVGVGNSWLHHMHS